MWYWILGILGAVFAASALYAPLQSRFYTLHYDEIQTPITIALLSDLHSGRFYQDEILQALSTQKVDMIAFSGDMIDDDEPMQCAWEFFAKLDERFPDIPRFYVSGNHEWWSGEIAMIKRKLGELGVVVLDESNPCKSVRIKSTELMVFGVDDPYVKAYDENGVRRIYNTSKWDSQKWRGGAWEQEWASAVRKSVSSCMTRENAHTLKILLSHRPEFIELWQSLGVDVILSGHTHGGQVRIPYVLNGLYAPNQGLLPRYGGGVYALESTILESKTQDSSLLQSYAQTSNPLESNSLDSSALQSHTLESTTHTQHLVVSRGLSLNYRLPRIFNPPEVVFITLRSPKPISAIMR